MKTKNKQIILLYLKNNEKNWSPVTDQTKNIREKTNEKIRILGNKYYLIKNIFEKLNLKRDDIFEYGKILEQKFKNQKKGISLQNQKRRMKDALYCWYAEFFFDEICIPNSIILKKLVENSKNKNLSQNNQQKSQIPVKRKKKSSSKKPDETILSIENDMKESILQHVKINQEIDSFDNSTISNSLLNDNCSPNYDFNKLFKF